MGRKRKVRGRNNIYRHNFREHTNQEYKKIFSEWDETVARAEQGKEGGMSEDERAAVATKAAMLDALQTFTRKFAGYMDRFDTNLGLTLSTLSSIAGSFVVYGTGENGTNEFVPTVLTVGIGPHEKNDFFPIILKMGLGEVQNVEEHIDYLTTGKWHELTKEKVESDGYSIFKKPMVVQSNEPMGIR